MPQTTSTSRPQLGIRLEGNQSSYTPGDTIIGCVYRKAHTVSPKSTVWVSLHGRTKSKMVVRRGNNSSSTYRGRFNLIPSAGYSQTLFEGPLHIQGNGDENAWSFAITLPKYVNPQHLNGGSQEESYLKLDRRDHILPSSYTLHTSGSTEGFVEYFLKATLGLTGQGRHDMTEATLPFRVLSMSPDPPIANFAPRHSSNHRSVSTYRLVPGMEASKLSFSQKMKQSFNTSSVPNFHFTLLLDMPTIIQLDNPAPIPFKLQAVPDWTRTSEVIRDIQHKIELQRLDIRIATTTEIKCEGTFSPHTKEKSSTVDLCAMSAINALGTSLCIPYQNDGPPLDIGELINLRLGTFTPGFPRQLKSGRDVFSPTFTTFNIRHSHMLQWELRAEVMGEHFDVRGAVSLEILAPSDERGQSVQCPPVESDGAEMDEMAGPSRVQRNASWIRPPDEDQAPPSFAQVQKEDSKAPE